MIKKILQKIFKKVSYYFFLKIYGKIEDSIKFDEDKRIKTNLIKFENNKNYNIYEIENARVYTDRIHNTAVILENKIIEGPSFQLKNNNNSPIHDNIVFERGTPRKLRKLKGTVLSLLTGGGGNTNYWHWLYDVLPRLKLCEKVKKIEDINHFIFPSLEKKFQKETLDKLNIDESKILSSKKFRHFKSNEIIFTDHPYVHTDNSHRDAQNIPEWIIGWLKEKFLTDLEAVKTKTPKKFFIDRTDPKSNAHRVRSIVNENEVKDFLIKKDFTYVRLHDLTFLEQVKHFNNAECIIGLHGGGFANISFCKSNTQLIELRTEKAGTVIENLAKKNNLNYDSLVLKPENSDYDKQSGHVKIPIDILERKINNA